ncbi:FRG domain-containing protein [Paenibacillus sp. GD4]|uniref:FRG domain-containing protein n=1 Tax=Paenibacillus sp. GD4 TaxID=3068890 RepID=UPI002796DF61|nr:FRG domain-containing protein [Paenibacillus sp. GD4]MDQ1908944.1 FRG domain-containing protein [Paenibacillus sp. GD4]
MNNKVNSVETFFSQLPRLNEKMAGNIFYRGQSDIEYKLVPSVLRENFRLREHEIYSEVMIECSHEFDNCKFHNEILSKMQHYGVPTRLLDVTSNALVALYFACENHNDRDGVVFVIKTDKSSIKQFDSDCVSILSSLPRFDNHEKESISKLAAEAKGKIDQDPENSDDSF